jgi:hypothetical protein
MNTIFGPIQALLVYLLSVFGLTGVLLMVFSSGWFVLFQEWIWVWDLEFTPKMIIVIFCLGIANYLVEDYARCQCEYHDHSDT